jgi:hypothetical protein
VDRKETQQRDSTKKAESAYANQREISPGDAEIVGSATGRENDQGAEPGTLAADDIAKPVGATLRSQITGRHEPGMGANETEDGLSGTEEAVRHLAEDTPIGGDDGEDPLPVFERAEFDGKL